VSSRRYDATLMLTRERFAEGLTLEAYLSQMSVNKERLASALARAAAEPVDAGTLEKLGRPRKVMVITEDWCATSLAYVPFVASLLAADPTIELRVFLRDGNPDVMNQVSVALPASAAGSQSSAVVPSASVLFRMRVPPDCSARP